MQSWLTDVNTRIFEVFEKMVTLHQQMVVALFFATFTLCIERDVKIIVLDP